MPAAKWWISHSYKQQLGLFFQFVPIKSIFVRMNVEIMKRINIQLNSIWLKFSAFSDHDAFISFPLALHQTRTPPSVPAPEKAFGYAVVYMACSFRTNQKHFYVSSYQSKWYQHAHMSRATSCGMHAHTHPCAGRKGKHECLFALQALTLIIKMGCFRLQLSKFKLVRTK